MNYRSLAEKYDFVPKSPLYSLCKIFGLERQWRNRRFPYPKELTEKYPELVKLYNNRHVDARIQPVELLDIIKLIDMTKGRIDPIIELGCYKCGTTILMAKYLESINDSRKIIVCDSFIGVPFDNKSYDRKFIVADSSKKLVIEKLKKFNVFDRVQIVDGYFENTLKTLKGRFSFAFLDSDTYESGKDAIPFLCERTDGIIAIHDYIQGLPIKNAIDEYVRNTGLEINKNSLAYIRMVTPHKMG